MRVAGHNFRGGMNKLASGGTTPMLMVQPLRTAGQEMTDRQAYDALAQLMHWDIDKPANYQPTPLELKNARRQLTNRDLLWAGGGLLQDVLTKRFAGDAYGAVNMGIDTPMMLSPELNQMANDAISSFYDAKFRDENKRGHRPAISDLYGFIADQLSTPGTIGNKVARAAGQPMPKYLQHENRAGVRPIETPADLLHWMAGMPVMTPLAQSMAYGIGPARDVYNRDQPGYGLKEAYTYAGKQLGKDFSDFYNNNLLGLLKASPTLAKSAVKSLGASQNSFIP
jgi:hypothetical protein